MYGYIRPEVNSLRVGEYRQYRALYCGLCATLRRKYGIFARFAVSYDFTFLAMVLSAETECEKKRCVVHPLRGCRCVCRNAALDAAADGSIILAYEKLSDDVADEKGLRPVLARLLRRMLRKSYRKATAEREAFASLVREKLDRLSALERNGCDSPDRCADCFASILSAAGAFGSEEERRVRHELLYHVGRIVYLLDAADDLPDDMKKHRFNVLTARFSLHSGALTDGDRRELTDTVALSLQRANAALALMERNQWKPVIENVLRLGIPTAEEMILSGKWKNRHRGEGFF